MIRYSLAQTDAELQQILELQQQNLSAVLTEQALSSQGFVTVAHSLELLRRMNSTEAAVIATEGSRLAGYCLAMTRAFRNDIPVLVPMFETLDALAVEGKPLRETSYLVCGQICVAQDYRGKGIFDGLYEALRQEHSSRYPLMVTEIASRNLRSLHAHKRLGFKILHTYTAPDGEVWDIVYWPWQV